MAIHMFRVLIDGTGAWERSKANAAVEDWMSKQSEWEADPTEHTLTFRNTEPDGTSGVDYLQGDYRLTFDSEPKENLFQKLMDKLTNKPQWARVGYHECYHDDRLEHAVVGGCSFEEVREWTDKDATIPNEIPTLT